MKKQKLTDYEIAFLVSAIMQAEQAEDKQAMSKYYAKADGILQMLARQSGQPRAMSKWSDNGPLKQMARLMPQLQQSKWWKNKEAALISAAG